MQTLVAPNIDWYQTMALAKIEAAQPKQPIKWLTDSLALEYLNGGTPHFLYSYKVIADGEPVANLHTHSRNEKIIKAGRVKLEMLNHTLYSGNWLQLKNEILTALKASENRIPSRIDISIDGANHIPDFLNRWTRNQRKIIKMGKARFDKKLIDAAGNARNFRVGTGEKIISIYNKTKEIKNRSHKEYIWKTWERVGLDVSKDIWRVEMRLKSAVLARIKKFEPAALNDAMYLLSLFKTETDGYFEFRRLKNKNVTSGIKIDLFGFEALHIPVLEKLPRARVDGAYKAKMGIHNTVRNLLLGRYAETTEHLNHIAEEVAIYDLQRWYDDHISTWIMDYNLGKAQTEIIDLLQTIA
jgi:hypothetical protein